MMTLSKMAVPVKRFIFFIYHVGNFNVDLKCFYTFVYIATLFRSPIDALHGLAIQYKVVFVFEVIC